MSCDRVVARADAPRAVWSRAVSRIVHEAHAGDALPLIDALMPVFDAVERHALTVVAPPALVYRALWRVDFARSGPIR